MREGALHVGEIDGLGAVPVEEAVSDGELVLGAVKVVLVQDKCVGQHVAQQSRQGRFAAGRAAREADDDSGGWALLGGARHCWMGKAWPRK